MIKYFKLEDSAVPGIVKVEILKTVGSISTVRIVEIVRKSTFRPAKIGQTFKVFNGLLLDAMPR